MPLVPPDSIPTRRGSAAVAWKDRVKRRVYEVLAIAEPGDRLSAVFDVFILLLIFANVATLMMETVPDLQKRHGAAFAAFETFSVAIFSLEYVLRLWSADQAPRFRGVKGARMRYALTPLAILDLLSILPYWLAMTGLDLRVLRAVRLFRVLRVAKLVRYSSALQTFIRVIHAKREELVVTIGLLVMLLFWASSLIYYAERDAQPEEFSSIPAAMWWAICTLTTVGYGDVFPVTALGKVVASVISVLGIGIFALPTGILGAEFVAEIQRKRVCLCPHCGEEIDEGALVVTSPPRSADG
jgi:voltage-gated potassium channel